jgi:methylmalonyl-CoA mutase
MPDDTLPLAAEFPPAGEAQWRKLTEAALKGADFDKKLVSRTYDGLRIEPLYPRAHGKPVVGRPAQPWQVLSRVDHPDPAAANKQALDDLENGVTGLTLVSGGAVGAYGYGLDALRETIARALDGVYLDAGIPIELDTPALPSPASGGGKGWGHKEAGQVLAAEVKRRGIDPKATQIRFGYDPLGAKARAGATPLPAAEIDKLFLDTVRDLRAQGFNGPFAVADGRSVHAAGGAEAQELGFVIANAVYYLRLFSEAGIKDAHRLIWFRLAADDDQFLTIAKFRALRKLWARVLDASGLPAEPAFVSAETAWRMMTRRDPYVNMLRTTIAAAAAGIGGADAITALPFTQALGLPDPFARRVARNMQLVLIEESNLAAVSDPASGSGALEALTDQLARAGWALLQEIEAAGGAAVAIEHGIVQKKVAATRAAREKAIATRKDAITGSSDYPNLSETVPAVLDVRPVEVAPLPAAKTFDSLSPMRLAEPFEALRDRSDAMLAKSGARPKVFLATLGKPSAFTARATFARNFYEAGGIEAVTGDGYKSTADMVAAYTAAGVRLACLCSSDKVYEAEAATAAKALKDVGAHVHLAGRPGEHETAWRGAGVETFIYASCDALATLRAAYDMILN